MMKGQARWSGLVMGFDTHMIAGAVPALRPARPTQPNITNRSNPHYDETLPNNQIDVDGHDNLSRPEQPNASLMT